MHTLSILFVLALLVGAVFLLWQSLRPGKLSGRPGAGGGTGENRPGGGDGTGASGPGGGAGGRDGRPPTKEV